jgi:hypothetical protein
MPDKSPNRKRWEIIKSNKENDITFLSPKKDLNEHDEIPKNLVVEVKTQLAKEK